MASAPVGGWSAVQRDLVPTTVQLSREESVRAYSPLKQTFTLTHECYGGLIDKLSAFLKKMTAQKSLAGMSHVAVPLDRTVENLHIYTAEIMDIAKHFDKETKEGKSEGKGSGKSIAEAVPLKYGLNAREQVECVIKAQEIAIVWFTQQSQDLSGRKFWLAPVDKILAEKWSLDPKMHCFFYRQFKLQSSKEPFAFTPADLAAFGIKDGEKIPETAEMQCFAFAFLKMRELRAKEIIFQGKELTAKDLPKLLKDWGYVSVETPARNDLVLYIDSEGDATHLGRFLATGKVESKFGINMTYFQWHNIFDVPCIYGNRVIFMRKSE